MNLPFDQVALCLNQASRSMSTGQVEDACVHLAQASGILDGLLSLDPRAAISTLENFHKVEPKPVAIMPRAMAMTAWSRDAFHSNGAKFWDAFFMVYDEHPKPVISSYDSGYEHSVEHWFETRRLVEEADTSKSIENGNKASSTRRAMAADTCAKEYWGDDMYARVVRATIKPKRLAEFKNAVGGHDLPAIRSLPGFVDDLEMYLENKFASITFWRTEEDAQRFSEELMPRIAARSAPLVSDTRLRAEAYKIEHDTIHEVKIETIKKMESTAARAFAAVA